LIKKNNHSSAYPLGLGIDSRTMMLYFGISLFIHLGFIGYMVLLPESAPRRRFAPGSINVSLVSLPGPPASAPAPESKPVTKIVSIPKPEVKNKAKAPVIEAPPPKPIPVAPKPQKTVSLAPEKSKWKVKKSLKKKTLDRRKMIDQAVSGVQKKVEKSKSESVNQAIEALKKKVAQSEANTGQTDQTTRAATGTAGAGASGTAGSGGKRALDLIDIYKIEVAFQVERHWAFSEQLAGDDRALQASLVFRVLPSGEVTDIRFTERSGNAYLDESAHKAIVKASPVSPHPEGVRALYVTVALRFTPQGIK
jgi:colicin import membrane protein